MSKPPTIHTYFDNRDGQMIARDSTSFFNCNYDPIDKDVKTAFLSEQRTAAKRKVAIDTRRTFLCGCCKRPLKIVGGTDNGKKCFHFMHIEVPPEGECDYYEKVPFSKEEIKAMLFMAALKACNTDGLKVQYHLYWYLNQILLMSR